MRIVTAAFVWILFSFTLPQSKAHPLQLTTVTVNLEENSARVTVAVHRVHLNGSKPVIAIPAGLRLRLDGMLFHPSKTSVAIDEAVGTVTWEGWEGRSASRVGLDAPLFPDDRADSTVIVVYRNGQMVDRAVLDPGSRGVVLAESALAFSGRFIWMGIQHILSGLDHVLFVLGLLLIRGTFRGLLSVVTAFTIAHSITLSMTVLRIGSLPLPFVESAIALSIVAVGIENLRQRKLDVERRIWLAFGFGLFHGFGFAGALAQSGVPQGAVGWSLAAFNTGVEIGQVCIALAAVPLLRLSERVSPVLTGAAVRYASIAITAAGAVWFLHRVQL